MQYPARDRGRALVTAAACLVANACALSHVSRPSDAARDRVAPDVSDVLVRPDVVPVDVVLPDVPPPDVFMCPAGQTQCGDRCVTASTDRTACGVGCVDCRALPNVNPATIACMAGVCAVGAACNPGRADCDRNPATGCEGNVTTAMQCGMCGVACPSGMVCMGSGGTFTCQSTCSGGTMMCGASCADVTTDPLNCNGCGMVCRVPVNGVATCMAGVCGIQCNGGFHPCGTVCASNSAVETCGARCAPCAPPPNSMPRCVSGACDFECNPGFHRCGSACLSNLSTSSCGALCTPCPVPANAAVITCTAGACGFTCNSGFHPCGGACAPDTSPASCGTSCTPCSAPANATATCAAGACDFACNATYHRCGGACAPDTSPASCGTSCTPCVPPSNAAATCVAGACDFNCNPTFMRVGAGCVPVVTPCGNRALDAGETCDDGNTMGGDGCSATCTLEMTASNNCPGTPLRITSSSVQIYTGSTVGGANNFRCPPGPGGMAPDRVYEIEARFTGTLRITLHPIMGTMFDPVLITRRDCTMSATEIDCAIAGGIDNDEVSTLPVTMGMRYAVIVDGRNGSDGAYTLTFGM